MDSNKERKISRLIPRSIKLSMLYALCMVIIAMLSILIFYFFGVVKKSYQQSQLLFAQTASDAVVKLEAALSEAQMNSYQAAYISTVQNTLLSGVPETVILDMDAAMDFVNNAVNRSGILQGLVLCSANGRRLSSATQSAQIMDRALDAAALTYSSYLDHACTSPEITFSNQQYLVSLHPIYGSLNGYHSKNNQIILGMIISEDRLSNELSVSTYPDAVAVLTDSENGEIILSTKSLSEKELRLVESLKDSDSEMSVSDHLLFTKREHALAPLDVTVLYIIPTAKIRSFSASFDYLPFLLIILFIFMIAIMIFALLFSINRDVNIFVNDIRAVENGASSVSIPMIQELSVISYTLNDTLAKLQKGHEREQQLLMRNYEAELAQNRAELLAYRSQINPHFLFNTLESARSLSRHYKIAPVEQLICGMSRMFKASLYSPMIISLKDELEALDGYISVIDVRFPGRYLIEKHIGDNTLAHPVLSVLLQPLLENVIQHAFSGRKDCRIIITSEYTKEENKRLRITITDNGVGIAEEDLASISRKMKQSMEYLSSIPHNTYLPQLINFDRDISIGLANIYRRLKLTFGDHAHINITSEKDRYTSVELLIPFREENTGF